MSTKPYFLGIDLGTTNSAAAVFDGDRVELVRNAQGETITPSVVRIDAKGVMTVGARARRFLDKDPENIRTEFKRLIGAGHTLAFPASGLSKRPEELSAAVLAAIRADVEAQCGMAPERAVVSVPALFELPQSAATSEAARLAGFTQVDLIQEPVASALAAGWRAADADRPWLVFDLGGGTFDASLLESRDGLLRVIGHDGDNFLGGRDIDGAIVGWALAELERAHGRKLSPENPAHAVALRRLRAAAEDAKIELTRAQSADLVLADVAADGDSFDIELTLARADLERLVEPLLARTIAVCHRLLAAHGLDPRRDALARIVLVGGPTAMPILRERVTAALAAPFTQGLDPMTLVAQGAALYAATANLTMGAGTAPMPTARDAVKLWLQFPAVSSDLSPFIVGKLVDPADKAKLAAVVFKDAATGWESAPEAVDADGGFAAMVSLSPHKPTRFSVAGADAAGNAVATDPAQLVIVHGTTIGDPPLSRSVGVALASDRMQVFFERGSPLPMRRTFVLRTAEALSPRDPSGILRVPIVQGEFALAHLCRLVGSLDIKASELKAPLPAQSVVEVTIELDRGGRLAASARIGTTAQVFDQVAHLVAGKLDVAGIPARIGALSANLARMRAQAFQHRVRSTIERLGTADELLQRAAADEAQARGGDLDALERVRRVLVDLDIALAQVEADMAWPELSAKIADTLAYTTSWVAAFGTPEERTQLAAMAASADKALTAQNAVEVQRQLDLMDRLANAAYFRSPGAWRTQLDYAAGRVAEATDPRRAAQLVEAGNKAAAAGQNQEVERCVREIWALLPHAREDAERAHGSGVT